MKKDKKVLLIAGTFVFFSAILGYFLNKNWLFLTMFVGLNLVQYSVTDFCPIKKIL